MNITSITLDDIILLDTIEHAILIKISTIPYILIQSYHHLKPHLIAQYTLDLVSSINHWYSTTDKILDLPDTHQQIKYSFINSMHIGLATLMKFLHIPTVDHM